MKSDSEVLAKYAKEKPWGISTCIDLYDCNPAIIRSAKKIRQFITQICKLIEVKKFGKTYLMDFGENERVSGYSMMQLIETSLISGHFANQSNNVYLDIFSCKYYPPFIAIKFCQEFFEAKKIKIKINFRY